MHVMRPKNQWTFSYSLQDKQRLHLQVKYNNVQDKSMSSTIAPLVDTSYSRSELLFNSNWGKKWLFLDN